MVDRGGQLDVKGTQPLWAGGARGGAGDSRSGPNRPTPGWEGRAPRATRPRRRDFDFAIQSNKLRGGLGRRPFPIQDPVIIVGMATLVQREDRPGGRSTQQNEKKDTSQKEEVRKQT